MTQLKKDRLVSGIPGGSVHNTRFDEELDQMIEENFNLQDEERRLTQQVKKLQKKKQEMQGV